jgi:hypothetical protein
MTEVGRSDGTLASSPTGSVNGLNLSVYDADSRSAGVLAGWLGGVLAAEPASV